MKTLPNDPAQGITKREYFAVTIADGLAVGPADVAFDPHALAHAAIEMADALLEMLAERRGQTRGRADERLSVLS